jgi:antitoxin component of MazEF toxin-antitoxin module
MLKRLVKHGNSHAIVVNKATLEAAGIQENALFQISVNPSGGLVIQSVEENNTAKVKKNFDRLNKQYKTLMRNLAKL